MKTSLTKRDKDHENHIVSKIANSVILLDPPDEISAVRGRLNGKMKHGDNELDFLIGGLNVHSDFSSGFFLLSVGEDMDILCAQPANNPQEMSFFAYDRGGSLLLGETLSLHLKYKEPFPLRIRYHPGRCHQMQFYFNENKTWWDDLDQKGFSTPTEITEPSLISGMKKSYEIVVNLFEIAKNDWSRSFSLQEKSISLSSSPVPDLLRHN